MFHLHYDTDIGRLADQLADHLAAAGANPLQPAEVLVPQRGLAQYLVQRLAERHGVAANLEFLLPNAWSWRLLRQQQPDLPARSVFDRELLRFRLLGLLDAEPGRFAPPGSEMGADPLGRFHLAAHLATLFERYQSHRRELLEAWQRGAEPGDHQAELWRALLAASDQSPRSSLLGDFLQRHGAGGEAPAGLPDTLHVFDCVNLSADLLQLLGIVAGHCELHFYLPSPCRWYWGDLPDRGKAAAEAVQFQHTRLAVQPNPLLVSLGGVGRDFVAQLFSSDEVQPERELGDDEDQDQRHSLLQRIQADVRDCRVPDPDARRAAPDPADASFSVHASYSPLRAAQALHDWLLALFDDPDGKLTPRDVVVMSPDMGRYGPAIEAAFGALPSDDPRYIPFTVIDRADAEGDPLLALFLQLLDLPASRLTLDQVLDALAVPALARAAGVDPVELADLRELALASGIRWGEDEADRVAAGLPAYREFSWAFGRDRALLGHALGEDAEDQLIGDIVPLTDLEGRRAAAFAALLRVQRSLDRLRRAMHEDRSPAAWQQLLRSGLDRLLAGTRLEAEEERALDAIHAALAALAGNAAAAGYDNPINWQAVRAFVSERLAAPGHGRAFLSGGVTVCDMVPLRNVPFAVVCVLGLDAEAFPRHDPADPGNRVLADRLAGRPRLGDRSRRDDDRYLFLQTLMAAGQRLYLGYLGNNPRDGSEREPSAVLEELLDVASRGYFEDPEQARKQLLTRHPLQAFSPRLFAGEDPRLFTYRREWQQAAAASTEDATSTVFADSDWPREESAEPVEWSALLTFLKHPQRAFLRSGPGLALRDRETDVTEREPVADDNLARSIRDADLLRLLLAEPDADRARLQQQLRAAGSLPPLALGTAVFDRSLAGIDPALQAWRDWGAEPEPGERHFSLRLASGRELVGPMPPRCRGGYGGWVAGGSHSRWLSWWLEALVMRALDGQIACRAFGYEAPVDVAMPDARGAADLLDDLLALREAGLAEALPLLPYNGWSYAKQFHQNVGKGNEAEVARRSALDRQRREWNGDGEYNAKAVRERRDPWVALALRGRDPFALDAFAELAERVYLPLLDAAGGPDQ